MVGFRTFVRQGRLTLHERNHARRMATEVQIAYHEAIIIASKTRLTLRNLPTIDGAPWSPGCNWMQNIFFYSCMTDMKVVQTAKKEVDFLLQRLSQGLYHTVPRCTRPKEANDPHADDQERQERDLKGVCLEVQQRSITD